MTVHPTSIRIFLAEGLPDGLWLVEKSNWTGLALACPRSRYAELRKRPELDGSGVYVLVGPADSVANSAKIYVGETDDLKGRLDTHHSKKDFWTRAVVFTSKDSNLNKAHVRYLETKLIGLAKVAGRAELDNGTTSGTTPLSEPDRADAEAFLADMLLIYRVLGVNAFDPPEASVSPADSDLLYLKGKATTATGRLTAQGMLVLKGSVARPDAVPSIHTYGTTLRTGLKEAGAFQTTDRGLELTRDYEFSSPSTAAMVLLGRTANGRKEWKNTLGVSLGDLQTADLEGGQEPYPRNGRESTHGRPTSLAPALPLGREVSLRSARQFLVWSNCPGPVGCPRSTVSGRGSIAVSPAVSGVGRVVG